MARDDSYSVDEDVTLTANGDPIGVIGRIDDGEGADDNDVDGDDMDIAAVKVGDTVITDGGAGDLDLIAGNGSIQFETAAGGFVTIDIETGSFVYDQKGKFDHLDDEEIGSDSFEYKLTDGALESDWATVDLTINGLNDAPVARPDSYSVAEDATEVPKNINVIFDTLESSTIGGTSGPDIFVFDLNIYTANDFTYTDFIVGFETGIDVIAFINMPDPTAFAIIAGGTQVIASGDHGSIQVAANFSPTDVSTAAD